GGEAAAAERGAADEGDHVASRGGQPGGAVAGRCQAEAAGQLPGVLQRRRVADAVGAGAPAGVASRGGGADGPGGGQVAGPTRGAYGAQTGRDGLGRGAAEWPVCLCV